MSLPPLALSLWVALNATVLAVVVGLPLAWLLARRDLPGRDLLTVLVLLPMVLPPTVLGYVLLVLLGQGGMLAGWAEALGLGRIVFTRSAAVLAAFVASLPFLVRSAQAGFEQVDPAFEEAARTLGRGELAIWFTITLPLAWRAVLAGLALAFARAIGEFGATVMVAGSIPGRTRTGSLAIYDHVQAGRMDEAGMLVLTLALVAAGALLVLTRAGRGGGLVTLEVALLARLPDFELDVGFDTADGITALFGPSGAGKTLTLRHVAGLERAEQGRVRLGDRVLFDASTRAHMRPRDRRIGLVFQEYALFPHLDVGGNVGYGLHRRSRAERTRRVAELLELVGLPGYEERTPGRLSGGERQRVALARALAPEPELLLLDEPFAALDFRIRAGLREALSDIQKQTHVPMVLVTHSLEDVRALSEALVLIDRGRVVASGPTRDILTEPPTKEAAALVGARDLG